MFKILLVEDDDKLNKAVCSHLNRNGYEAVGCLNANDAYNAMYGNMFDLVGQGQYIYGQAEEKSRWITSKKL